MYWLYSLQPWPSIWLLHAEKHFISTDMIVTAFIPLNVDILGSTLFVPQIFQTVEEYGRIYFIYVSCKIPDIFVNLLDSLSFLCCKISDTFRQQMM